MNHKSAHNGLRKIRYWAARHEWQSDHDSKDHDRAQIKNISEALEAWEKHLFKLHGEELVCLLLDAKDASKGTWLKHPLLTHDDDKIRECLAKYFFLVQRYPKTIASVQGFFFQRLTWGHGILSFRLGSAFDLHIDDNAGVLEFIDDPFEETWITLPDINDPAFYVNQLQGFDASGWIRGASKSESPVNEEDPDGGVLKSSANICSAIWGNQFESCKQFIIEKLFTGKIKTNDKTKEVEQGMWVLANISWFLRAISSQTKVFNYHYYFFRALPNKEDFFHTSGEGLLSWASLVVGDEKGAKAAASTRQAIALTACLTLSRLSDAALPLYERRAVTQEAQSRLGQKASLMWMLDRLLLPVMLGATLERITKNDATVLGYDMDGWMEIGRPPEAFEKFIIKLWPIDPWRPQCSDRKDQLRYLLQLIEPLKAEGVPQEEIVNFSSISHDIKQIPTGAGDADSQKRDRRTLELAQTRLAAAGALFVPAQKSLQKIASAFEVWCNSQPVLSDGKSKRQELTAVAAEFPNEFERLGQLSSLQTLITEWTNDPDDGVIHEMPCGKTLKDGPFPKISLPFYITDLDFAYRALRDNWKKENHKLGKQRKPPTRAHFRCCSLPDQTFVICWRETPGLFPNYKAWFQEAWKSLHKYKEHSSVRGLPLVLRFAAQNNAAHLWVQTNDRKKESILGKENETERDRMLATLCETCPIKSPPESCYEIGMIFRSETKHDSSIV